MLTSARLFHLLKGPGALSFLPRGQRAVLASSSSSITSLASLQRRPFHTTEKASESALTVWQDLKELRRSPTAPLIMGFSGLLPFAAAPLYMVQAGAFAPEVASAQLAYGAAILSFLGGVRWGMLVLPDGPITPTWMQYTFSVTPSLVAWGALLLPPAPGLLTCMGGLCAAGYLDLVQYGYPSWFKGLRFCLTTVALLSLWSTLMCKMMLEEQEEEKKRGN